MLDLLVVIWLMLHWLKILVAVLKSWYRQPPRYVSKREAEIQRKATTKLRVIETQKSKYVPVYKTVPRSYPSQADEKESHDQEKDVSGQDDNHGQDFKPLLEGLVLVKRKDSKLTKNYHESETLKKHVPDQVSQSRLSNINGKTVERSLDFKNLVEGPTLTDRKDQQWGPEPENYSLENIYQIQNGCNQLLNADRQSIGESYILEATDGPIMKHTSDDLDVRHDFTLRKIMLEEKNNLDINSKHNFQPQMYEDDRENVTAIDAVDRHLGTVSVGINLEPGLEQVDINSHYDTEHKVDQRELKDPVSQKMEVPKDGRVEVPFVYKNKLFVETIDVRKEHAAEKEAIIDFHGIAENVNQIKPVGKFISQTQQLLEVESNNSKVELETMSASIESTKHVLDNAATMDVKFETKQNAKLMDLKGVKLEVSADKFDNESTELKTLSPKLRKSDVPSVSELLVDETPINTNCTVVHSESDYYDTSKENQLGDVVLNKAGTTEMKSTVVDSKVLYKDERETAFDQDTDASFQHFRDVTSSEYRSYQRNDSFAASVESANRNFEAELDKLYAKYQTNTADVDKPSSETTSHNSVAPDLEAVTGTMKEQLAASSVLSGIPYSNSFGLVTTSPTRYSRTRHDSQPSLSQEIKSLTRRSSLELYKDDCLHQKKYTLYRDLDTAETKRHSKLTVTSENLSLENDDSNNGVMKQDLQVNEYLVDKQSTEREITLSSSYMSNFEQSEALPEKNVLTCAGVKEEMETNKTQDIKLFLPSDEKNDTNHIMEKKLQVFLSNVSLLFV